MDEKDDAEKGEGEVVRALKRRRRHEALTSINVMSSEGTQSMKLPEF